MFYGGASFLKERYINTKRIQEAREQLSSVGGENIKLKTPDGDIIDR